MEHVQRNVVYLGSWSCVEKLYSSSLVDFFGAHYVILNGFING